MPSNKIALPSFVTGPRDALVTVDVFSGTAGGIVNSIQSLAAKYDVDLIGMLRAGAAAAQLIPVIEGIANGKLLMNPQAAIARLLTASNTLVAAVGGPLNALNSTFNALSSDVQAGIAAAGQVIGDVEVTIGNVVSTVANGAISDIQALGGMINQMAGGSGFLMVDTQALGGFAAGIINQCAKYGISGAFAQITKNITDPRVLNAIIGSTLPNLISASDIGGLQALANVANIVGIAAVNPRMLPSFTRAYIRLGSGSTQQASPYQDASTWGDISGCYATADPSWNVASRAGDSSDDPTLDLSALQNGTDDFNSVLSAGVFNTAATTPSDTTTPFYGLAPLYPDQSVDSLLKQNYPNTYIDPALRGSDTVVEPTQAQYDTGSLVNAATSPTAMTAMTDSNGITSAVSAADAAGSDGQSANLDAYFANMRNQAAATQSTAVPNALAQNDTVGDTPAPVNFTQNGKTYQTVVNQGHTETYLVEANPSGVAGTSTAINWGGGVLHSDGHYLYTPVNTNTLAPL